MLREYLEAMRALWTQEEASYDGELVKFGASWAWPKPVQAHVPVIIGGAGSEKNLTWITRSADGWMTTPQETDIDGNAARLREIWWEAGRTGSPEILVLAGKPDPDALARWAEAGVTEVIFGLPDRAPDDVVAYLHRLAGRLGLEPTETES